MKSMDFLEQAVVGKGCVVVYKADVQHCQTVKGVLFSVRLNKVKKLSCPGCAYCGAIEDDLSNIGVDWPIIGIEACEHGKLYTISECNISKDWETGVVDDWDLKVTEYIP